MPPENDDKSDTEKPAVSFKTEGEFLAAVAKKSEKAVRAAVEKAKAELLASLGAEGEDDLSGLKAKLESSKATVTEAERLKGENAKQAKQLRDLERSNGELTAFRTSTLKRTALAPFAARTADKTGETLADLLGPKLQISDDGAVTGPDGKGLEETVTALLDARPFLRAPDWKPGGGTGSKPKPEGSSTPAGGGNGQAAGAQQQQNGTAPNAPAYKLLSQAMQAEAAKQSGGGGSGP